MPVLGHSVFRLATGANDKRRRLITTFFLLSMIDVYLYAFDLANAKLKES
jgi:hypothetical protein